MHGKIRPHVHMPALPDGKAAKQRTSDAEYAGGGLAVRRNMRKQPWPPRAAVLTCTAASAAGKNHSGRTRSAWCLTMAGTA